MGVKRPHPKLQTIVTMWHDGLSAAQISELLGMERGTVANILVRAGEALDTKGSATFEFWQQQLAKEKNSARISVEELRGSPHVGCSSS